MNFITIGIERCMFCENIGFRGIRRQNNTRIQRKTQRKIEWEVIRSARNFYAHAYDALDWTKVWETLQSEIPLLKKQLEKIISDN